MYLSTQKRCSIFQMFIRRYYAKFETLSEVATSSYLRPPSCFEHNIYLPNMAAPLTSQKRAKCVSPYIQEVFKYYKRFF